MMSRTQITLEPETQRLAQKRAGELGVSFAEYIRRLVARDLHHPRAKADISRIFNLGNSGGTNIAKDKDRMLGEATAGEHRKSRR
ncbi:MAG TPA: hypothetical protein VMD25_14375 [Acidobacteriaceae bacterium]|nr:hypothetical protein [Acidobacteriaceae bacterium]